MPPKPMPPKQRPRPGQAAKAQPQLRQRRLRRLWRPAGAVALLVSIIAVAFVAPWMAHRTFRDPRELAIWWHAPFFSPSGYGTEAVDFVLGLDELWKAGVWITQHGDTESEAVFRGFPPATQGALLRMATQPVHKRPDAAVIICHSEPGAWSVPTALYRTSRCPPEPVDSVPYAVGRTMFESDRISHEHARRMNAMDEVWVPTDWQREVFAEWGVQRNKLQVIPEAVDSAAFNPAKVQPLPLPIGRLVFGLPRAKHGGTIPKHTTSSSRLKKFVTGINWRRELRRMGSLGGGAAEDAAGAGAGADAGGAEAGGAGRGAAQEPFVFLSSFKWETRKGWDILLSAFLTEFSAEDPVALVLMTKARALGLVACSVGAEVPSYSGTDFAEKMRKWAKDQGLGAAGSSGAEESGGLFRDGAVGGAGGNAWAALPTVYVHHDFVPQLDLLRLYRAADCFVIASRGEGWGRPHVEAMAMGLPLIATNWSGPTAYLDDSVGYPLPIDGLVDTPPDSGAFKGHKWAQPSVKQLRRLMRHVVTHRQEAAAKGRMARQRMVERYAPAVVAKVVADRLQRVQPRLLGDAG
eukprot:scaffold3.g6237.t1